MSLVPHTCAQKHGKVDVVSTEFYRVQMFIPRQFGSMMVTEDVMRSDEESPISKDSDAWRRFLEAVAVLAEGELTFGPPFDLATSVALADNIDVGDIAQRLFDVSARRDTRYHVAITAHSPSESCSPVSRTVVDTTVGSTQLLLALLDDIAYELEARRQH